jgi:hypothetical protein
VRSESSCSPVGGGRAPASASEFANTPWIAGAEYRLPVTPVESPILTVVRGPVAYPPELAYPNASHTNEPAVVTLEKSRSRCIYFPGNIERRVWRSGHTDLNTLLNNCVEWIAGENVPVRTDRPGVVEAFAETQPGFAVHVLNHTNPAMFKGWIRGFFPIGPQTV